MNLDEMILISVDDHIVEPPDLFTTRMDERFRSLYGSFAMFFRGLTKLEG